MTEKKLKSEKKKDGRRRKVPKNMRALVARRALRANIYAMSESERREMFD